MDLATSTRQKGPGVHFLSLLAIYVIGWLILYSYPRTRALALGCIRSTVATDGSANLAAARLGFALIAILLLASCIKVEDLGPQ